VEAGYGEVEIELLMGSRAVRGVGGNLLKKAADDGIYAITWFLS
jgi:hypothetical protein